jgi:hypothetical protein
VIHVSSSCSTSPPLDQSDASGVRRTEPGMVAS